MEYRRRILDEILEEVLSDVAAVAGFSEHLLRLFILDPAEAWSPAFAPLKRLALLRS
ncbi:MAG TPA: hypothetical protein VF277_00100 [Steroidobacteraceae bacterium]